MRCAIYSRFSTDAQNPSSAADQTRACRRHAEAMGWQVVEVYEDEAVSGASRFRVGFQRLLQDARQRRFEVVVSEALDRLGRKLADIADMHDQLSFQGIALHTLQQGLITPMHIGLLGTMSQLALADIRAKTQRGLRAVAEDGRSAGGLCYGYRAVSEPGRRRGERVIHEPEASVVRRIHEWYAAGLSPRSIASRLNAEQVPGPRGGAWSASAIHGQRAKGTGIINNELYIGRQLWGRRSWTKDPRTGKRVARIARPEQQVITEQPALRIVSDAMWNAVKERQAQLDRRGRGQGRAANAFWQHRRPSTLFSGLMRCGVCGGGYSKISATHFGCSTARNQGPTSCANRLTIRQDVVENRVLDALRTRLMDPDIYREFVAAFTEAWNRERAEAVAGLSSKQAEVSRIGGQMERLVDALADGAPAPAIKARMQALEERRERLEQEMAAAVEPAPRLHPNLAEVYRQRMSDLSELLRRDDHAEAREAVRELVEEIRLVPEEGALGIELRGELAAMLRLADASAAPNACDVLAPFWSQIKRDAGTGFEPVTFRL